MGTYSTYCYSILTVPPTQPSTLKIFIVNFKPMCFPASLLWAWGWPGVAIYHGTKERCNACLAKLHMYSTSQLRNYGAIPLLILDWGRCFSLWANANARFWNSQKLTVCANLWFTDFCELSWIDLLGLTAWSLELQTMPHDMITNGKNERIFFIVFQSAALGLHRVYGITGSAH